MADKLNLFFISRTYPEKPLPNWLRRVADPARTAESAERLSLLTEFIVVIDELRLDVQS